MNTFASITLFAFLASGAAIASTGDFGGEYIPGEVLVKFRKPQAAGGTIGRFSHTAIRSDETLAWVRMKISADLNVKQAVEQLRKDPNVEAVQPNFLYRATGMVPNDPHFPLLWGLKNTAQSVTLPIGFDAPESIHNPGIAGKDMGLVDAWASTTDCSGATVAIIDTGVNYLHEDLIDNMWDGGAAFPLHGIDLVDSDNDPMDLSGHGTHVAGTIAAAGNNGKGSTGVCWKGRIMAIRVLNRNGEGYTSGIVDGIRFAVDHGARIINMSLGGYNFDEAQLAAIEYARDNGVLVVTAAGNDGVDNDNSPQATYPCSFDTANVLCVAAVDQFYDLPEFSNYGAKSVDVAAPGVNILSAWPGDVGTLADDLVEGWTFSTKGKKGWAYRTIKNNGQSLNLLSNPVDFGQPNAKYESNADDRAKKLFDLNKVDAAILSFAIIADLEKSKDYFRLGVHAEGKDPFDAGGTPFPALSGSTRGTVKVFSFDVTSCGTPQCAVGFQLLSNNLNESAGVALVGLQIRTLRNNSHSYNLASGTSMATPHVAALAAMLMTYHPEYTYTDTIAAINESGLPLPSLTDKTVTGKAVQAANALSFVSKPVNVQAVVK